MAWAPRDPKVTAMKGSTCFCGYSGEQQVSVTW